MKPICANDSDTDYAQQLGDMARTRANISSTLFVAGGIAAAVGVYLWVTSPTEHAVSVSASAAPGSADGLQLVVDDIEAARAELVARGAPISEVFHDAGGVFHHAGTTGRVAGPAPDNQTYGSWASFSDPDGNGWMLQEVKTRLPGRGISLDVDTLVALLRETEEGHGAYERSAPKHHWSDWYAAYLDARQRGRTPDEATRDAAEYME